jgi:DNA-binding NarL/FixJ family response regulator
MPAASPQLWIGEPNPIFRQGLVACAEQAGHAVGGALEGLDPEPAVARGDLLLFDVESVGVARAARFGQAHQVALVGIVSEAREEALYDTLMAGFSGVLLRDGLTPERVHACLEAVIAGQGSIPPALMGRMLSGLARGAPKGSRIGALAAREVSVLRLLAEGESTREIASELAYSERTVKNIVHDLLTKLDCRTRAHAVALATRQGVI